MLPRRQLSEVLSSLWNHIVIELEDDAAGVGVVDGDIELEIITTRSVNRERAITATLGRGSGQRQHLTSVEMGRRGPWRDGERLTKTLDMVTEEEEEGGRKECRGAQRSYGWGGKLPIRGHQHQDHPRPII